MTYYQPPAAILIRQPFVNGSGAEVALVMDAVAHLIIARALDCDEVRVFDVRHDTEFFFPAANHARRILGTERAIYLLGGTPGLIGREGLAELQRELPRLQQFAADAHHLPPLPESIARRCGTAPQASLPDLPDFGDDRPPGSRHPDDK